MRKSYFCIDRNDNSCLNTDVENRTSMTEKQKKEYADVLKDGAKELGFKEYGAGRKAV